MRPPIGYIVSIYLVNLSPKEISLSKGKVRNFCMGPSCGTHIYIHTFFYLISYIYTQKSKKKKKSLVFSIKIIFDDNLS